MNKLADQNVIKTKIRELFAYRKLTDLFRHLGLHHNRKIISDLYELQYRIYLLDAYLESNWTLEPDKLNAFWDGIKSSLDPFRIKEKQKHTRLEEIVEYERIEQGCRQNQWPTEVSFHQFYTTKSCDVRLIRHLLYSAFPDLEEAYPLKAWSYYDLITEVNDDIADVYEDLETYNGNRFLISILRNGHHKTRKMYFQFLAEISYRAEVHFKTQFMQGENAQLFEWTAERALETSSLLDSRISELDMNKISSSWLLSKMS